LAGGVVPKVEAPERSGFTVGALGAEVCFGRVPEVDGVGDECELLAVVELVEPELAGVVVVGAGAGGAAGRTVLTNMFAGPKSCNLGTVVQLYWNSGTVSSSPVRNLYMSEVSNVVHNFLSSGVNCSKVFLSLIKRCCAIFINGSRQLSAMPVFKLLSTLLI